MWLLATAGGLGCNHDDPAPRAGTVPTEAVTPLGDEQPLGVRRVKAALWPNLRGTPYTAPTAARVAATEALVSAAIAHALGEADASRLPALAHEAGLVVERWRIDERSYLALLEGPTARGTTGAFVLRIGPRAANGTEQLLQAPHAFHDVGTGELALAVFLAAPERFRGLFTNTLHRYAQADGTKEKRADNPADVCHNEAHAFVAATMGAVRALGRVEVVQLHGFGADHVIEARPDAWAVVSAGDAAGGSPRIAAVAEALRRSFGATIARHPEDVDELGGTTNAIGRRVRAEPSAHFLHLELSAAFREALLRRPEWHPRLAAALGASEPPEAVEAP